MKKETSKALVTSANTQSLSLREDAYYIKIKQEALAKLRANSERLTDRIKADSVKNEILKAELELAPEMQKAKIQLAIIQNENKAMRAIKKALREDTKIKTATIKANPHPLEQTGVDANTATKASVYSKIQ